VAGAAGGIGLMVNEHFGLVDLGPLGGAKSFENMSPEEQSRSLGGLTGGLVGSAATGWGASKLAGIVPAAKSQPVLDEPFALEEPPATAVKLPAEEEKPITSPDDPSSTPPSEADEVAKDEARKSAQDRLNAKREATRLGQLDDAIQKAEAAGKLKELPPEDQAYLTDPRVKSLAYDPDTKSFKPGEARAALRAEEEGSIPGPVQRDYVLGENRSSGGDFVDGEGNVWDMKDARAGIDSIIDKAAPQNGKPGENILVDATRMSESERAALGSEIVSKAPPGSGQIVLTPNP